MIHSLSSQERKVLCFLKALSQYGKQPIEIANHNHTKTEFLKIMRSKVKINLLELRIAIKELIAKDLIISQENYVNITNRRKYKRIIWDINL